MRLTPKNAVININKHVGWVERSEAQQPRKETMLLGFAAPNLRVKYAQARDDRLKCKNLFPVILHADHLPMTIHRFFH
jgi:hypothetical protein